MIVIFDEHVYLLLLLIFIFYLNISIHTYMKHIKTKACAWLYAFWFFCFGCMVF